MNKKTDKTKVGDDAIQITDNKNSQTIKIEAPIFLLFTEYLGFVSNVIDFAEEWCKNPKTIKTWKKNVVITDALNIFHKIKKMGDKYPIKEIIDDYNKFYEIALKDWITQLNKE